MLTRRGAARLARPAAAAAAGQRRSYDGSPALPFNVYGSDLTDRWEHDAVAHTSDGFSAPQSTVHSNGMRIVTQDRGEAASSIAFYIDAGTMYETEENAGVSHGVASMIFKSNLVSSGYHTFKTYQHAAVSYHSNQVAKRWIGMKAEMRRDLVAPMMQRMCEGMFVPRFDKREFYHMKDKLDCLAGTHDHDPALYITEKAVSTAFAGSALANPNHCPQHNIGKIGGEDLVNWWAQHFVPSRIILAGINVSNEELTAAFDAAEWSGCAAMNPSHAGLDLLPVPRQQTMYQGGQFREYVRNEQKFQRLRWYSDTFVVYARRAAGRASTKDYATSLVAAGLVGGIRDFTKRPWDGIAEVPDMGTFGLIQSFDSTGLVGGLIRARPENAGEATKALAASLNSVGTASEEQLAVAKKLAKVHIQSTTDAREDALDFFALHAGPAGCTLTPGDICTAIDSVTSADMKRIADYMQGAPATLAVYGDLKSVPGLQSL